MDGNSKALAESTRIEYQRVKIIRKPPIGVMVLTVLYDIKARRGVTLKWLRKTMEDKYSYKMSSLQYTLLKKKLRSMLDSGAVKKLSGIGLTGRLGLVKDEREKIKNFIKEKKKKVSKDKITDLITPEENMISAKLRQDRALNAPIKSKSLLKMRFLAHKNADTSRPSLTSSGPTTPVSRPFSFEYGR